MDFNEIQNAWNNDKNENVTLPTNLEKLQAVNTPLDKIRKNLKNEFIYQIISIIVLAFVPLLYGFSKSITILYFTLFSIFVAICVYYLLKLYFFYKRINNVMLNTKDSLYETYFDIRLNMEIYKTFGFALTPFLVLFVVGLMYFEISKTQEIVLNNLQNSHLIILFVLIAFCILFMGIALEWWVKYFYGKYAKEIKKVLEELKEQ